MPEPEHVSEVAPGASIEGTEAQTGRSGVWPVRTLRRHPGTSVLALGALVALAGGAFLGAWRSRCLFRCRVPTPFSSTPQPTPTVSRPSPRFRGRRRRHQRRPQLRHRARRLGHRLAHQRRVPLIPAQLRAPRTVRRARRLRAGRRRRGQGRTARAPADRRRRPELPQARLPVVAGQSRVRRRSRRRLPRPLVAFRIPVGWAARCPASSGQIFGSG